MLLIFHFVSSLKDAVKSENGRDMAGEKMVVEWAKAKSDRRDGRRGGGGGDDRYGYGRNGFSRGGRPGGQVASRAVECYECGERGHYARDCRANKRNGGGRDRDRDRDSHRRRDSSRSRSRTRSRDRKHKSSRRDRTRSKERSPRRVSSREKTSSKRDRSVSLTA